MKYKNVCINHSAYIPVEIYIYNIIYTVNKWVYSAVIYVASL